MNKLLKKLLEAGLKKGDTYLDVVDFEDVLELTLVSAPAAGGKFLKENKGDQSIRILASYNQLREDKMKTLKQLLEAIKKIFPDVTLEIKEGDDETKVMGYITEALKSVKAEGEAMKYAKQTLTEQLKVAGTKIIEAAKDPEAAKIAEAKKAEEAAKAAAKGIEPLSEEKIAATVLKVLEEREKTSEGKRVRIEASKTLLTIKLKEAKVSDEIAKHIMPIYEGQELTDGQVNIIVSQEQAKLAALSATGVNVTGQARDAHLTPTLDQHDKWVKAIENMLAGHQVHKDVAPFAGIHDSYRQITGYNGNTVQIGDRLLREIAVAAPGATANPNVKEQWDEHMKYLRESTNSFVARNEHLAENVLLTTTWTQAFADAQHKRFMAVFELPDHDIWRKVVSFISSNTDYKDQHAIRLGGFANLSTVSEDAVYLEQTWPADEETVFSIVKRGNIFPLTRESMIRDDLKALAMLPKMMAQAAGQTLVEFVFDFFLNNPNMDYDSVAWFAAGHNNLGALPLTNANLRTSIYSMKKQTQLSSGKRIGVQPRYLVHPVDLGQDAFEQTKASVTSLSGRNETIENWFKRFAIDSIEVPYWTDVDDWFLLADPMKTETIEISFLNGRQVPELFVQDAPTVGENFTRDRITWKLRHEYGGEPVEHRGIHANIVP